MNVLTMLILLMGCPQDSEDYMPGGVGTEWVFDAGSRGNITAKKVGQEMVGGASCEIIETIRGKTSERMWIEKKSTGLWMHKIVRGKETETFQNPICLLQLPLQKGRTWRATIPMQGQVVQYKYEVLQQKSIRVLGEMRVGWEIKMEGRLDNTQFDGTSVYVPGIGLASQKVGGNQLELKKFTKK